MEEKKQYTYKLIDDFNEEDSDDFIFCTDKDAKELIEFAIDDIWHSRYGDKVEDLAEFNYNEEDNTITLNDKEYQVPENYGELISFIFDLLEDNGIKTWRPIVEVDETFYY